VTAIPQMYTWGENVMEGEPKVLLIDHKEFKLRHKRIFKKLGRRVTAKLISLCEITEHQRGETKGVSPMGR